MIERINEFIENQGFSIRAFEQKISASNGLIRKAIANNTDIQSKWLTNIVENYPQINPEWLLTGKGAMLREHSQKETPLQITQQSNTEIIQVLLNKIEQQAQELGKLKERLAVFEEGEGHIKGVEGVEDAEVAAAG